MIQPSGTSRSTARRFAGAAFLVAVAAASFAAGRSGRPSPAPAAACAEAGAGPGAAYAAAPPFPSTTAEPPAAPAAPARPPARRGAIPKPRTARAPVAADEMARAADEARAKLERMRGYIASSCWRPQAAAGPVKLTYDLAFDAGGHEIARVIREQHRGEPGAVGACIKKLAGTALSISPPGATIAVSVVASYP